MYHWSLALVFSAAPAYLAIYITLAVAEALAAYSGGPHAHVVGLGVGLLQLEEFLLGSDESLHELLGVRLQVLDYLVFLEDHFFERFDVLVTLLLLLVKALHLFLCLLYLLHEFFDLFVFFFEALESLFVDLFERILNLLLLH